MEGWERSEKKEKDKKEKLKKKCLNYVAKFKWVGIKILNLKNKYIVFVW